MSVRPLPALSTRVGGLSSALLLVIFLGGAAATWAAGTLLSKTTDALDARLGLGDDIGGLIFLSLAGSLPEIAITISACRAGEPQARGGEPHRRHRDPDDGPARSATTRSGRSGR